MTAPKTVLITGASGYIAKHIIVRLLNQGYHVRGSVRTLARGQEVRDAVQHHISDPEALSDRLTFVALDLAEDSGWDAALEGVDVLIHTASPFPLVQPKNEDDIIKPAVEGALRALRAAYKADVHRVVMTSSSVAIMNGDLPAGKAAFTEEDWSPIDHPTQNAYGRSKTLAEKAAWDFVETEAPDLQLTMINPGFVLGAPLDKNYGTSLQVIERLLKGTDPMLPNFGFATVDVADIAEMHVRVLDIDESIGRRFIGADRFVWFAEMAKILKDKYPDRKIPTRIAPNAMIRLLSLFDSSLRTIVPVLGVEKHVEARRAQEMLNMSFRPVAESIAESGAYLVDHRLV